MVRQVNENSTTIYTFNLDSFEKAKQILNNKKIEYYTYTPKSLRNKNLVLKGIKGDFTTDEIMTEINALNLQNVKITKVVKIAFNEQLPNNFSFLVQLSNDSHTAELTKIKHIAYQKIKWEPLKKKELYQCRNCQRIGHSSVNCRRTYRCVKCKEAHEPGKCLIAKDTPDKENLYCVNCETVGHPASYRGCPFMKFSTELKKDIRIRNVNRNDKKLSNINETSIAYPVPNKQGNPLLYSRVLSQANPPDFLSILEEFKNKIILNINLQLQALNEKIIDNSSKINSLFDILNCHNE